MRALVRYPLRISVAAAMLTGCGGSQPPIGAPGAMPQSHAIATHADAQEYRVSGPLLYVVNFNPGYNDVTVYHARARDPSPIETITDGLFEPAGNCIDRNGSLYVTNEPASSLGWVLVYPLGQTKPSKRITKGINIPKDCAIDAHGNLWVANIGGSVTEYKEGSAKLATIITNGVPDPNGIAIDHSGNIYVSNGGANQTPANVVVYAPGAKSPTKTITDGVQSPIGIAIDASGTLYVTNYLQNNVKKYRAGQDNPYQTMTKGMNWPVGVTVGKNGWLYVTNAASNPPAVIEFAPGSLTPSNRKITKGLKTPQGSTYFPPLLP
jgi:sugar lactone lactonase YvrE